MQRASTQASGASPGEQSEESGTKKKTQSRRTAMNTRCRLALQQSHTVLMKDIDVKRTTDALFSRMVLTLEDKQKIQEMPNENEKRTTLLDILPQRSQGAYDELCECLASDQPWLRDAIKTKYDNITDDDLVFFEEQKRDQRAESTTEIVGVLRENLKERMNQWKTALEQGFPDQEGLLPYIDQPYGLESELSQEQSENVGRGRARIGKPESGKSEERIDASRSIKLIEESTPGQRITFFGGAGTGKTTLLKEIARSWIDRSNPILVEKFTFMFLIPLRFVGKTSLLNTICDELKLFPTNNAGELDKSVHRNERKTLFLLDSFDELRLDVIQEEISEIGDLITGRLFPRSTVVVTSRPVYNLRKLGHQKIAQLKDLPEAKVKKVILEHLGADQSAVDEVLRSFPAMAYLQKPINLALFLFIISKYTRLTHSRTQADLFSIMLQYFMLACAKKKKLPEFDPQPGSFLANKNIHKDIRRLFSELAKKCYDEKNELNGVLHVEDPDDLAEYVEFGLFTKGSESNTVVLPHPLFQEYIAAAHIAENPKTWNSLFEEIREQSESQSPKSLIDIVRPMGLENIVRFAVALSPHVCEELASLFVIEREKIEGCENYRLVNFEYCAELVLDCSSENGKRVLATALLKAPVVDVADTYWNSQGKASLLLSSHVIDNLDYSECVMFLKKVHNLAMCETDGKLFVSCTGDCKILEIRDSFPVALVHKYDCHIETDQLIIRGDDDLDLDLPASMFPSKVSTVHQLKLYLCTLHSEMPDIKLLVGSQHVSLPAANSSLESVYLYGVDGLEHCDVITQRHCRLHIQNTQDITVRTLKTCFPEICDLKMERTVVLAETEEERMSWLSTIPSIRGLGLAHIEGGSPSVSHQMDIWIEKTELEYLRLKNYTLSPSEKDVSYSVRTNEILKELELRSVKSDVDLAQLFEVCGQCKQLTKLVVSYSQLAVRVRDTSHTYMQNNTLSKLYLLLCTGEVDLGRVFDACGQCSQLTKLTVDQCQLAVRARDVSDNYMPNSTLSELYLLLCTEEVDLGEVFDACRQCSQLTKLTVDKCQLAVRARDASDPAAQNSTLAKLHLVLCKGSVDLGEVFDACRQCSQLSQLIVDKCQLAVRARAVSDNYMPNSTLSELYLLLCTGEGDLGEVFDACRQCSQLTKLTVDKCQLAVRARDASDPAAQNSTLAKLHLVLCKGSVDLGEVFDACRQCSQLSQLIVDKCQLAVRARDVSDNYMPNSTLSELYLLLCTGEVDLGEVFDACRQCSQLTKLTVDKCQLAVRARDASDPAAQNSTLAKLHLVLCKGSVDLGEVFDACRQCSQLSQLIVDKCQLAVRARDVSDNYMPNSTLIELYLLLCTGEVDLGEVFDACRQCSQLTKLTVDKCQLAVRARDVSDNYMPNSTLSELYLLLCTGEVDLGEVFDACRQCSQLAKLTVGKCQLAVRARDASDPAAQNSTLAKLHLVLCKGSVDLGEVFDACRQCSQLTKLTVDKCQLAVRARDVSDNYMPNSTLSELYLLLCTGEVDLGEVFDACRQCSQLTKLTVDKCQLAVRARDASDPATQNSTLAKLHLVLCKGSVDLGEVFDACRQCSQLSQLIVDKCQLAVRARDVSDNYMPNSTLSELYLLLCTGEVDLGEVFDACRQCSQLAKVTVDKCQLTVRARDASDPAPQNSTLAKLHLVLCKGSVDLGEVFDACRQCSQLSQLIVDKCQLAVRVRDASLTCTLNKTLNELQLLGCTGDIDLGTLFEACNHCLQLTILAVGRCQLRVGEINTTAKQNNTLSKLGLAECKGNVDLGKLFEVCSHCLQLETVFVRQSHVVLDAEKIQSLKQMPRLQSLKLVQSSVHTPSGQRLSSKEVNKILSRLCPNIHLFGLDSGPDKPETGVFGRLDSDEAGPETGVSADMASSDPSTRRRRKGPLAYLRRLFKK